MRGGEDRNKILEMLFNLSGDKRIGVEKNVSPGFPDLEVLAFTCMWNREGGPVKLGVCRACPGTEKGTESQPYGWKWKEMWLSGLQDCRERT